MLNICLYFHVHQPYRIRKYRIWDIGNNSNYFTESDEKLDNVKILNKVAQKCYLPTNSTLLALLKKYPDFKISFSFTGIILDQLQQHLPDVLDSFRALVDTGRVDILAETYHHSLAFLFSKSEFESQVKLHTKKIKKLFGITPKVFRNTELIYNNELAQFVEKMGYKAILAEGASHILGWRSPNFVYRPVGTKKIKLLLKNYKLSDDIAFRFGEKSWEGWPLTAEKFSHWVSGHNGSAEIINLFMDYETFGEHQWEDTGIFNFLSSLPGEIYRHPDNRFVTVSEAAELLKPVADLDIPHYISWADVERDLSAWLSNPMQEDAVRVLYELEPLVLKSKNKALVEDWRRLQTSDHFYYMCTKWFSDGDVHKYFNPYDSPYEAFIYFMNALSDLRLRIGEEKGVVSFAAKKSN